MIPLKHIFLFGSAPRVADRQIVFGTVPRSIYAFASWFATADVTLDQRASQDARTDSDNSFEEDRASEVLANSHVKIAWFLIYCYIKKYKFSN